MPPPNYKLHIRYFLNKSFLKGVFYRRFHDKNKRDVKVFLQSLDKNINRIVTEFKKIQNSDLSQTTYPFKKLKMAVIKKKDNSDRILAIPSVADRLVQKTFLELLSFPDKLSIYNSISYGVPSLDKGGFIDEKGVFAALKKACVYRDDHAFVLKLDIESFFDNIDRQKLKKSLQVRLKKNRLLPTLLHAINSEINETKLKPKHKELLKNKKESGKLLRGRGLRQGMPLSPLFSNYILKDFDKFLEKKKIIAIRYIDDLLVFAKTKKEIDGFQILIEDYLHKMLDLNIHPKKTAIYNSRAKIDFLGFQLKKDPQYKRTICKLSQSRINALKKLFKDDFSNWSDYSSFQEMLVKMNNRILGYKSVYGGKPKNYKAVNFGDLDKKLRKGRKHIIQKTLVNLLGKSVLRKLDDQPDKKKFLGIDIE